MANRIDQTADDGTSKGGGSGNRPDSGLQHSVDKAVPASEKLPDRAGENPLSQQVKDSADRRDPKPGSSTLQGGDEVQ
ncbi:hypothetical protein [Geminicoccus roseus]|uniref:hypothetical protein n=1 Tax=Geminicoccus roseus TaxID=404900 RepID=UPI0004219558|nr:hypothetical protein [Geminicoccus roseus]